MNSKLIQNIIPVKKYFNFSPRVHPRIELKTALISKDLFFNKKIQNLIWHLQISTKICSFYCKRTDLTSLTYYHNHVLPDGFQYPCQPTSKFIVIIPDMHLTIGLTLIELTNIKQFTVLHHKIWNSLPCDLISLSNIATFKRSLKQYLIAQPVCKF